MAPDPGSATLAMKIKPKAFKTGIRLPATNLTEVLGRITLLKPKSRTSVVDLDHRVGRVLSVSPVVGIETPPPL
jgi:hypothetical protein